MALRVFLALTLLAAPLWGAAQTYTFRHVGVAEGVGHVRSLDLSPNGYVWLATPAGILRHDGIRTTKVLAGTAEQVAVSPDGTVWALLDGRLVRRGEGGLWRRHAAPRELALRLRAAWDESLYLLALASGDLLLHDVASGLWRYHPPEATWTRLIGEAPRVRDVAEAADGSIWVLTQRRLGRLTMASGDTPGRLRWVADVTDGMKVAAHPDGAWVSQWNGDALLLIGARGQAQTVLDEASQGWHTRMHAMPDGTLGVMTRVKAKSLFFVFDPDGEVRHVFTPDNGLQTDIHDQAHFDDEGGLWLGSEFGLEYVEEADLITSYRLPNPLGFAIQPTTGMLWVGSYRGLFRYQKGDFEPVGADDVGRAATPPTFEPDGTPQWTGFGGQPFRRWWYRWEDGRVREVPVAERFHARLPRDRTLLFRRDGSGDRALASYRIDGSDDAMAAVDDLQLAIGPPPRRRVWAADGGRLLTIEDGTLDPKVQSVPRSVREVQDRVGNVTALQADRWGRIWVATRAGLVLLHETAPDTWAARMYGPADAEALPGATAPVERIEALFVADGERLWLGSDLGVHGFTLHAEAPWLRPLPLADLNAALPAPLVSAIAEDGNGFLWVAPTGSSDIVRYDWANAEPLAPPALHLTQVAVNERPLARGAGALRFRADTTRLSLALAPTSFRRIDGLRYQYRVAELDTNWATIDGDPDLRFAYLAPGRYTVEARALRAGRVGPTLSVPLHLTPPFYRAGWFLALCALALVGAVASGVRWRLREAARHAEHLEATVLERTADLRREKATTEQQAARLAELDQAKSRFFANISHELRTPLTLLLGPIRDALSARAGSPEAALSRQLPSMRRSGERLLGLVDELLDLARLDAGHLTLHVVETDLIALTRRIVSSFGSRAERERIALSLVVPEGPLAVWVDAERYEQVLTNLLVNAFKFTPSEGRVRVSLAREEAAATLTVRDTGTGIPAAVLPTVFERFRQADDSPTREHSGAGIGLALVHELVTLHGGTVAVESTPGFGSLFTVRLPLGRAHLAPEALAARPPPPHARRSLAEDQDLAESMDPPEDAPAPASGDTPGATVLIIEDHPDMRAYLRDVLGARYTVEEAENGRLGLEAARGLVADQRTPALILSDVMMPEMGGYDLCREIKADPALGHVPVVLLTARADEASRLEGLGEGADDYLAKPFSADELLARCENLIEVRRRLRARFSGEVVIRPTDVSVPREEADWLDTVTATAEPRLGDASFGVDWLADEMGLSTRQLRRRIKAASGLTPGAFLRTLRLERAAQLLDAGGMSIADVASAVGYADAEHFSRVFRQGFGVPPSAYASTAKENE